MDSRSGTPPVADVASNGGGAPLTRDRFRSFARRYGFLGAMLGLGSPLGLLFSRFYLDHAALINGWLLAELQDHGEYYIYAGVGTVLAMAAWGLWSGRKADGQRTRAEALERASARLKDMAFTDGLTGVYVRRRLLEKLDDELRRGERYAYPIASLFVDVDNFKMFNEYDLK